MVVSGYCRMQLPPINGVAQHTNGNAAQDEPVAPVAEGWNNVRKCATLAVADSAPRRSFYPPPHRCQSSSTRTAAEDVGEEAISAATGPR